MVSNLTRAERNWSRHSRPATTVSQPRTSSIVVRFGPRQPQERLLRNVFRTADVAQHLVGEVDQVGPVVAPRHGDVGHGATTNRSRKKLHGARVTFSPRPRP